MTGYINSISPSKNNFKISFHNGANATVKAICFDATKRKLFEEASLSGDPLQFTDIVKQETDNANFADYIINQKTSI